MQEHERIGYEFIGHYVLASVVACREKNTEIEAVKTDLDIHTELSIQYIQNLYASYPLCFCVSVAWTGLRVKVLFVDSGRGPLRREDRFPQTNPPLKS